MIADLIRRQYTLAPSTWNPDTRTVEAVISAGSDVERLDPKGVPYIERLDLTHVDPARLVGIPVLDGHRQDGAKHVVGVVLSARHEADQLAAVLKLSDAPDVASVVRKIVDQILRGISIGYASVGTPTETKAPDGRRVRTIRPLIREVSVVAIPADGLAHIRSETMPTQLAEPPVIQTPTPAVQTPPVVETRAALNAQIRSLAETAGLDRTWADQQIDAEADINAARAAAFEAMATRGAQTATIRAHVGVDHTAPDVVIQRSAEALACRMTGAAPSDEARSYMELGLHDHVRQSLARAGENVGHLGREALLTRSAQGTSDFPLILDGAAHKVLRHGYGAFESPLKVLTKPRSMTDLKPVSVLELGTASELKEITEHGEIQSVQLTESGESYRLATYAGMISLTRAALINDDLGAFAEAAMKAGQLAAEKEAKLLADAFTGAYKMRDGKALFHADHANLAASGAAPSITTLSAARQSLRTKTGLDGVTPANVTPKFLVVGAALETVGEQILAALNATAIENQNVFAGKLALVVDARIAGNQWFVVADPSTAPVFELAHLGANTGPQIEVREGWRTLGREWRVIFDVGVGVVDTRGAYKNPGAA